MDWIARQHVWPVEDREVRIPLHLISAKTMNKHPDPFWIYDKLVDISTPLPPTFPSESALSIQFDQFDSIIM